MLTGEIFVAAVERGSRQPDMHYELEPYGYKTAQPGLMRWVGLAGLPGRSGTSRCQNRRAYRRDYSAHIVSVVRKGLPGLSFGLSAKCPRRASMEGFACVTPALAIREVCVLLAAGKIFVN